MQLYLGVDAGGTKTQAQIVNENHQLLGEGISGGANPHNQSLDTVLADISQAVELARKQIETEHQISTDQQKFTGACIGMAGLDTQKDWDKVISAIKSEKHMHWAETPNLLLVNDGYIGLKSGTEKNHGVCIISGTGSNCFGISPDGEHALAGDWGFMLGDQGSGFSIGRAMLRHSMKEYDGRVETTILSSKILEYLELNHHSDLITWVYREKIPVKEIAGLTRLLDDLQIAQLTFTEQIIQQTIQAQVLAFETVTKKINLTGEFPVVLIGGLTRLKTVNFAQRLKQAITEASPAVQVVVGEHPPVTGALALAGEISVNRENPILQKFLIKY